MRASFTLFILFISFNVKALDPNHFTITRVTAPYFVVDANSPATITKAYVGFEVKNNSNSATTYNNLKFTITSIGTSVSGQNYSVISPAGGIVNVGTLAPGETKVCYYYVSYPAHTSAQATVNISLTDNTASSKTQSFNIYNRSSISANAGGTATQTITNQDIIGSVITDDVSYVVGNVQNGDENDFQVAVSAQFDPTKVTLLSTKVISSSVPGIAANTTDSLYFISGNGSNGATVVIRWTFKITATNFTTYLLPCAGATSGSTNYKYALNTALGQGTPITVSAAANPLTISKTSNQTLYGTNSTAIFTVTISNPSAYAVTIDKIVDQLPTGFTYTGFASGTQVTASNSTIVPSVGATGSISFEGAVTSGSTVSYSVPASGTIVLKYTATTPSTPASNLVTTVRDYIGTTEVSNAQNTVSVSAPLPVHLISFKATPVKEYVKLDWITVDETNSSHFELERSIDNGAFNKIAEITAAGNSLGNRNYSFIDSFPAKGMNNYRLKMVDKDLNFKYSAIVSVLEKQNDLALLKVFNNPFSSEIKIAITSGKEQPVQLQLLDIAGKIVVNRSGLCHHGTTDLLIDGLNALQSGVYLLKVATINETKNIKLVKQ